MAHTTHPRRLSLSILVLLLLITSLQVTQGDRAEKAARHVPIIEGEQSSPTGLDPAAFLVIDVWLTKEGVVSLTWSDLGSNFVYTVEYCDSLSKGNWAPSAPTDQWPIVEASWTDAEASGSGTRFYRIQTEALHDPPAAPTDVTADAEDGKVVIAWSPVPGASSYNVYWSTGTKFSPLDAEIIEDVTSPFTHSGLSYGVSYNYVVTAVGNKGESEVSSVVSAILALPLDGTVATTMAVASEFLYTGETPIQTGVSEGTMDPLRVAVMRGKVTTRHGQPLPEVTITVLDHPEYGQTLSRADGMFDMVVNGGGFFTVTYEKEGYLQSHRQIKMPWQDYGWLTDVVLIQQDSQVTTIDLTQPDEMQVARGSVQTDEHGSRQATLLVPAGTQAELLMPDGSTQPIAALSVRATEYTVGPNGPKAMPAELPPTSFYTYAVELSVDETAVAGAREVRFDQPLYAYVENFRGFPVGIQVPSAYYDREKGAWIPSPDGRVIQVLAITGDMAVLDTDGDEMADDTATLESLGVTDAERRELARLYKAGQTLWRVPVSHFTPYDWNWSIFPPADAVPPGQPSPHRIAPSLEKANCQGGHGTIEFQNQVFGEAVNVAGTPFILHYSSDRVPGNIATNTVNVPLSGDTVPESLKRIVLEIKVAGRRFRHSLVASPHQSYAFTWDGKDAYGRLVQGVQVLTSRIGYVYQGCYGVPPGIAMSFGIPSSDIIPGCVLAPAEIIMWQEQQTAVNLMDARRYGIGGWTLNAHHVYDPVGRVLYLGDGRRRSAENINKIITTVAGDGSNCSPPSGPCGDGGPAILAQLGEPRGVAVGPDGSFYIAASERIRRVSPDGTITTIAGLGEAGGPFVEGGLATEVSIRPRGLAIGPDGSIYFNSYDNYVRRVSPEGRVFTVAGTGTSGFSGDGGPATQAQLGGSYDVAVGPDGSVYIPEWGNNRVRRVGPNGIIHTIAGNGSKEYSGDGGPATQAGIGPSSVAVAPDGSLYIADRKNYRVRRVGPDGIITTVAGKGLGNLNLINEGVPATDEFILPEDVAIGPDGSLYMVMYTTHRIRRVGLDGIIMTVAGSGPIGLYGGGFDGDGGPAAAALLKIPIDMTFGPDGSYYIADRSNCRVRRVRSAFPSFDGNHIAVASEDGGVVYQFSEYGRHLRTVNAQTGTTVFEFVYDAQGRLTQINDNSGNITTIERDASDNPAAIVGPFGQRTELTVNADGYLASVANPAGETTRFSYINDGLLESVTSPREDIYSFTYDDLGRLVAARDPAGGSTTLSRSETQGGFEVTVTSELERVTKHSVTILATGAQRLVAIYPEGATTEVEVGTDGTRTTSLSDSTATTLVVGPDPRFGMQTPIPSSLTITTPGGLSSTTTMERTATLIDPDNPFDVDSITDRVVTNGRVLTRVFDAASRTLSVTSPAGRGSSLSYDAMGRIVRMSVPNLHPINLTYDERGRPSAISAGSDAEERTSVLAYNTDGQMESITNCLGRTWRFLYDKAGRMTQFTLADGRVIQYDYDEHGNVTSITPPGRPLHAFAYTAVDLEAEYSPPDVGEGANRTVYAYDADRQLVQIARPDGVTIRLDYDDAGRPSTVNLPTGEIIYGYDPDTGKLGTITAPDGGALSYSYDGMLLTSESWGGPVVGTVTRAHDNDFRVTSISINGGNPVALQYDDDDLLTSAGAMTFAYDAQNGHLTSSTLSSVSDTWTHNGFAEPLTYRATYEETELYSAQYTYDRLGRIVEKTETVEGSTDTYNYTYELGGRMIEVKKNGIAYSSYTYDSNGNRLSYTGPGGTSVSGTCDDQDRLLQYGNTAYTYTANGALTSKIEGSQTTAYQYGVLGGLLSVDLPDGTQIEYVIDGRGRRIGKKRDGVPVQGFLYESLLNPIAELDGNNNVVSLFVYGSRINVPDYIVKGGVTCRIISDHLGSPRLVVNAETAEIVQRMDYDEFGRVIADTNPGFQPFGFAGGLYDPDTGFVCFRVRDYDPMVGRWTAKDPILFKGGSANLYAYVGNDPVNLIDPSGLGPSSGDHLPRKGAGGFVNSVVREVHSFLDTIAIIVEGVITWPYGISFSPRADPRGPTTKVRTSFNDQDPYVFPHLPPEMRGPTSWVKNGNVYVPGEGAYPSPWAQAGLINDQDPMAFPNLPPECRGPTSWAQDGIFYPGGKDDPMPPPRR